LSSFSSLASTFRNRNYAIYTAGNWLSLLGFWMQRVAVSWLTWELSHSEFWVGAVAFAEIVPLLIVGPIFGVWADRFDRKTLAMVLQSLMLAQAVVLFVAFQLGWLTIGWLFGLTLLEGCLQAAFQPVRLALIPALVRRADLVAAAAFTAVTFNVARFVGPAIAGVVFLWSSPAWAILFNGFSYLFIIIAWRFIKLPPESHSKPLVSGGLWVDMRDGWRYITQEPALAVMFGMLTLLALFARPLTYMLAAFVGTVYHGGPETLALFTSAVGVGAVFAALKLSMQGKTRGLVRAILLNSLLTLVSMIGFVFSTNETVAAALMVMFGYTVTICAVGSQTLVQNSIDDAMRGRVLSLWVAATRGPPALGVLLLGWLASRYGLQWPFIGASVICLIGLWRLAAGRRVMREYFENDVRVNVATATASLTTPELKTPAD
jgi:MFS family permease